MANQLNLTLFFQILGLKGNPMNPEIMAFYNEPNGTRKLLEFMLDNINGESG